MVHHDVTVVSWPVVRPAGQVECVKGVLGGTCPVECSSWTVWSDSRRRLVDDIGWNGLGGRGGCVRWKVSTVWNAAFVGMYQVSCITWTVLTEFARINVSMECFELN